MRVLDTGDRSEIMVAYYAKYEDAGVEPVPIDDLYKRQVRSLCSIFGLLLK